MNTEIIDVTPIKCIKGEIVIPADKSISHRSLLLNSIANGTAKVYNLLPSEDVLCTKAILKQLGISIIDFEDHIQITGGELQQPSEELYCGNSGTTMRLLLGLLAPNPISVTLTGDASLSGRPMKRVTRYLKDWAVSCLGSDGAEANYAPLQLSGKTDVPFFEAAIPIASAQVKSALALVALQSNGAVICGGGRSRDHTERMIRAMGGQCISEENGDIEVKASELQALDIRIPSDFSSAAFFIALGLLLPDSELFLPNININPTRSGFLETILEMGADITIENRRLEGAEEVADLRVRSSQLKGVSVPEARIATMIDEIPILSVLASQAEGLTRITGAEDLRHKESDRLEAIGRMFRAFGLKLQLEEGGFEVFGPQSIQGGELDAEGDHRIAMSGIIMASAGKTKGRIKGVECIGTSFPSFLMKYKKIGGVFVKISI